MKINSRITIDQAVCHGKPCIRGMHYLVESVLEWLASGMNTEDIDYENIERKDVLVVLSYTARLPRI